MENVMTVIIIGIGVVLLLVFQAMVLASLNKESEQAEPQPWYRRSIIDIVKSIVLKIYSDWYHFKDERCERKN